MDMYLVALFTVQPWWLPAETFLACFTLGRLMPVGSFLAAMLGLFLVFWRQTVSVARNGLRRVFVRRSSYSSVDAGVDGGSRLDSQRRDETADRPE